MVDRITKILTRRPNAGQTLQAFAAAGFRGQPIEQTLAGMGFPDQRTQAKDLHNILTQREGVDLRRETLEETKRHNKVSEALEATRALQTKSYAPVKVFDGKDYRWVPRSLATTRGLSPKVLSQFPMAPAPGGNVSVVNKLPGMKKWHDELSKGDIARRNEILNAGTGASKFTPQLAQMSDLLSNPGFETHGWQPAVTKLQSLLEPMGVDLKDLSQSMGIKMNALADSEDFNRLARQGVIEGFEKFKGNLNQKEVEIALDAFASLGLSTEANIRAVAAARAASEMARLRAANLQMIDDREKFNEYMANLLTNDDATQFRGIMNQYVEEIEAARAEVTPPPVVQGADNPTLELMGGHNIPEGAAFDGEDDIGLWFVMPDGSRKVLRWN